MEKKIYVIGAGGFGREVVALIERINKCCFEWKIQGFIDDEQKLKGKVIDDYLVVGGCEVLDEIDENIWVVCAIGNTKVKKSIIGRIHKKPNIHFATLIDPTAIVFKKSVIEEGSIICAGSIITINSHIGKHVIINLACTLGHDCIINDFTTIYPGANISGQVVVGAESEIGTGAKIIQGKNISENVILGAGAVVVKNIVEPGTYVGVPVKKIK